MVSLQDIHAAQSLLRGIAVRTPLLEWTGVTAKRKLFLKLENLQPIGAFKLRGAYNKVASLSDEERTPRRDLVFERQSRAGSGLRGARLGREGYHRHAQQCAEE